MQRGLLTCFPGNSWLYCTFVAGLCNYDVIGIIEVFRLCVCVYVSEPVITDWLACER